MQQTIQEFNQPTMRDYLRILFRKFPFLVLMVVLVVGGVFIGLAFKTPVYEAKVKMLIAGRKQTESRFFTELSGYNPGEKMTVTQSEVVKSLPVLQRVVDAVQLDLRTADYERSYASPIKRWWLKFSDDWLSSDQKQGTEETKNFQKLKAIERLRNQIEVQPVRDTNTFLIKVRDYDADQAAVIANVVSRSYVIFDLEQQLADIQLKYGGKHPKVVQLRESIDRIYKSLDGSTVSNVEALGPASVKIIEQAAIPLHSEGVPKKALLLAAFAISLFLGSTLVFIFNYFDSAFYVPQDIQANLKFPFLGSIPKKKSVRAQFLDKLTDQIYMASLEHEIKVMLLVPVETTSSISAVGRHLARAMAEKNKQRILIVDADMRAARSPGLLGRKKQVGLSSFLEGKKEWLPSVKKVKENVYLMPAGCFARNTLQLLNSEKMDLFLKEVREQYDVVIVNTPAVSEGNDCLILAEKADATVLVVEEGKTRRQAAKAALQVFQQKKTRLLGTVLSERTFPIPKVVYNRV